MHIAHLGALLIKAFAAVPRLVLDGAQEHSDVVPARDGRFVRDVVLATAEELGVGHSDFLGELVAVTRAAERRKRCDRQCRAERIAWLPALVAVSVHSHNGNGTSFGVRLNRGDVCSRASGDQAVPEHKR